MANTVTRADRAASLVADYADYWRRTTYWVTGWPHLGMPPAADINARLTALGEHPDPDAVDAIIGRSATYGECDACGEKAAVTLDFDVNCGEFLVSVCRTCCARFAAETTQ